LINIVISLDHPKNDSLGILNIVYYMDKSEMRAKFVPESGTIPSENYSETFDLIKCSNGRMGFEDKIMYKETLYILLIYIH